MSTKNQQTKNNSNLEEENLSSESSDDALSDSAGVDLIQGEHFHTLVELGKVEEFENIFESLKFIPENLKAELAYKKHGLTVTQHAVKRGKKEIIKALMLVGYDFADCTETGENLLDFAIQCNSRITHFIYTNNCYLTVDEQSAKSRLLKALSSNDLNTVQSLLKSTELDAETKFLAAKFAIHFDDPGRIDAFWNCIIDKFKSSKPSENVTLICGAVTKTLKNKCFKAFSHLIFLLIRDAKQLNLPIEFKMVEVIMTCQILCGSELNEFLSSRELSRLRNNLIQLGYVKYASYFFPLGAKVVPAITEKLAESDKSFRFYAQICLRLTDEHAVDYDDVVKKINHQPKSNLILKTPALFTTLLHYFSSLGTLQLVIALVKKTPELLPLKTVDKETAFDIAYNNQNFDVALFLLEKGAEFKKQTDKSQLIEMVFCAENPELELQLVDVFKMRNWLWEVVSHPLIIPLLSQRAEFWKKLDWVKILEERFCYSEEDFVSSHKNILKLLKTVLDETNTDKKSSLYKLACCDKFANYDALIKACKKSIQAVSTPIMKSKKNKSKTEKSATNSLLSKLLSQYAGSDAEIDEGNWQKIVKIFKSTEQVELEKIDTAEWIKLLQIRIKHSSATGIKDFVQIFEPQGICAKVLLAIVADEKLFNGFKQYLPEFIKIANGTTLGASDAIQWKVVHHLAMRSDEKFCVSLIKSVCNKVPRLRESKTPDGKSTFELACAHTKMEIIKLLEPGKKVEAQQPAAEPKKNKNKKKKDKHKVAQSNTETAATSESAIAVELVPKSTEEKLPELDHPTTADLAPVVLTLPVAAMPIQPINIHGSFFANAPVLPTAASLLIDALLELIRSYVFNEVDSTDKQREINDQFKLLKNEYPVLEAVIGGFLIRLATVKNQANALFVAGEMFESLAEIANQGQGQLYSQVGKCLRNAVSCYENYLRNFPKNNEVVAKLESLRFRLNPVKQPNNTL